MSIDLSELMGDPDFTSTIVLRRANGTTFANVGVATVTYAADVPITAIVQPAKPSDLEALPAGTSLSDVRVVWCRDEIKIGDQAGAVSDILIIDGEYFRVIKLEDRAQNGFWKAFAERFEP